jgi:class 3 adenylate cyclase
LAPAPRTRYTKNRDGLSIAYQVVGDGPVDIVLVLNASCVDLTWRDPVSQRFRERLSQVGRVVCFDWSGIGASDNIPLGAIPTPELWSEDIRAVLDAVGSRGAFVLASQQVGPLGVLFAALHPELASGLILVDSCARQRQADDYEFGWPDDVADGITALIVEHWGSDDLAKLQNPSRQDDQEFLSLQAVNFRLTMSAELAEAAIAWLSHVDVRGILGAVHTPTFVLHSDQHPLIPIELGRYLAEHIEGAQFVTHHGSENFLFSADDGNEVVDRVAEFITGAPPTIEADRVLTTVLFTDVVGSTELATRLGDADWLQLLARHDELVEKEIHRGRGRKIKSTGDGMLATFDGPARAVRCAQNIAAGVRNLGLEIRAGIHTGEVELLGADIGGITVHICARVAGLAGASQILVSSTVSELVRGSGIEFEDIGEHTLKGVPDSWRLLAVKE